MLRLALVSAFVSSTAAFAPSALPLSGARTGAIRSSGPSMQLYKAGEAQGKGVSAIPFFPRPTSLKGDMPGDLGFDPVGVSSWVNAGFLQEAEIKHCRLAMLGLAGCFVESVGFKFPGVEQIYGTSTNVFELHNLAVQKGSMGQILLWTGLFEIVVGVPAMWATIEGNRIPGDFKFDPLGLGKKDFGKMQLSEIQNGRLAMLALSGFFHHALINGKGMLG